MANTLESCPFSKFILDRTNNHGDTEEYPGFDAKTGQCAALGSRFVITRCCYRATREMLLTAGRGRGDVDNILQDMPSDTRSDREKRAVVVRGRDQI